MLTEIGRIPAHEIQCLHPVQVACMKIGCYALAGYPFIKEASVSMRELATGDMVFYAGAKSKGRHK